MSALFGSLIAARNVAAVANSVDEIKGGRYVLDMTIQFKSDLGWKRDPKHPRYDPDYDGTSTIKLRGITTMTAVQAAKTRLRSRMNMGRGFRFRSDNTELVKRFDLEDVVAQYSYHGVFIIRLNKIQATQTATDDYRVIRAAYSNIQLQIDNKYAKAGVIRPDIYLPNACAPNLILELYRDHPRFQTKKLSALMTHEALYTLGGGIFTGDYGMTVEQIAKCLTALNAPFELINMDDMLIVKGEGDKHIPKFRAVISDAHAWAVSDDMCRSFDHKTRKGIEDVISKPEVKSIKMKPVSEPAPISYIIDSADELFNILKDVQPGEDTVHVISNTDAESLIEEIYKRGYKAGRLRIARSVCESFTVRAGHRSVSVTRAGDKYGYDAVETVESANAYRSHSFKIQSCLMTPEGMSSYSPTLLAAHKSFPRVATIFNNCEKNTFVSGFDQVKAYSVIQRNLHILPVFCDRDEVIITNDQTTRRYCFYICYVHELDPYIAPTHEQFLYYETVNYLRARGRVVDIKASLTPHKTTKVDIRELCNELVADPLLSKQQKKSILNSAYGLQARTKLKSRNGRVYQSQSACEAAHNSTYTIGSLHVGYDEKFANLSSGYLMNSRIILECHARSVASMVEVIGNEIVAFNTDCAYVLEEECDEVRAKLVAAGYVFNPLRELDRETAGLRCANAWTANLPNAIVRPFVIAGDVAIHRPEIEEAIHMRDEWDTDEFKAIANKMNVLITGAVPGVGKTHMAVEAMVGRGLVITPWNKLGAVLRLDKGVQAITLHKLLGLNPEGKICARAFDVSDVDCIHFDEIYLLTVEQIVWILDFIKANSRISYTACGDPWQLEPINQELTCDLGYYYRALLSECFPKHVELLINKRVASEKEAAAMYKLIAHLKAGEIDKALAMLEKVSLVDVVAESEAAAIELMKAPHICYTNAMKDRINVAAYEAHGSMLKVGDVLSGIRGARVKDRNILSNAPYEILKRTKTVTTLSAPDKSYILTVPNKELLNIMTYSYCSTTHSVQGCSLGDKVNIWEYDHPLITSRWLLTAISRASTLSGVRLMRIE